MTKYKKEQRMAKAMELLDKIKELSKEFCEEVDVILNDEISENGNTIIAADLEDAIKMVERGQDHEAAREDLNDVINDWNWEDECYYDVEDD